MRILVVGLTFFLALNLAHASEQVTRGGFGFLFPDHNAFRNPGQLAVDVGTTAEIQWAKFTGTHEESFIPSVMYSNGMLTFGVFASRHGDGLENADSTTDAIGGAIGLASPGGKYTFGLSAGRNFDIKRTITHGPSTTAVDFGFSYNDLKDGFSLGAGLGSSLGKSTGDYRFSTLAFGYRQKQQWATEIVQRFSDLSNLADWELGAFASLYREMWYLSGGYNFLALPGHHQVLIQTGLVLGRFDLSLFATYAIADGENPFHGGSIRVAF